MILYYRVLRGCYEGCLGLDFKVVSWLSGPVLEWGLRRGTSTVKDYCRGLLWPYGLSLGAGTGFI